MGKNKNLVFNSILLLVICLSMLILGYWDAKQVGVSFFEEKVHTVIIDEEADIKAMGKSFHNNICYLDKDITITDSSVLSSSELPFIGEFDGQGHTITFECEPQKSLFGYIGKNGVVRNLNVVVKSVTFDNQKGGILAIENKGQILDCTVTLESAKITVKGNYGGAVVNNRGLIKNVIVNTHFENAMSEDVMANHARLTMGGICAYNHKDGGEINSCIVQTTFANFNETDEEKIFAGQALNPSIGSVYGINNGGIVERTDVIISDKVYVADCRDQKLIFKSSAAEVYTDENLFINLGFNDKKWELVLEDFGLIQGE